MTFLPALKSLYAVNGFVAVLLYLPQIARAWSDRNHALSLSPVTFGGWCIGSIITALYACLSVHDHIFTAVSLGNTVGSGALFLIVISSRIAARRDSSTC
ncbi:PQ-loop domain-containing transporter [Geomonas paludis]|uniref:PQ-loop domain-containing transporter n=1 Tax=Geomonas paludis TaxID=2740185 RepID=A0A6V8MV21_9BACT|nr:PQ-loop domain-containing transporter [Geomonas paludis]UPU37597.1 PQ-loop domain-containing transporter [Geomonas paludis]GFO63871.1 hypothetical protein GMPD_17900 [Geomonas paludis]